MSIQNLPDDPYEDDDLDFEDLLDEYDEDDTELFED